ncbi:MAG: hypothetical protein AUK44_01200 [Porphyromonadaceae bacterium CG2_30_38_12]|nr:MAG: hypothetical protein AUK44_01200 [Porphyromonadaceae bacterium CG2_30_38_12]
MTKLKFSALKKLVITCLVIFSSSNLFSTNYKAYRTQTPPLIDGIANESCWKNASCALINQPFDGKALPDSADFYGRYKVVWDASRLYVLMEITDDKLVDNRIHPKDNYWEDDIAEIFIDEDRVLEGHACGKEAFNAFAYHISAVPRDKNNYAHGSFVPFDAINAEHHVIDLGEDCDTKNALNLNDHINMKVSKNGNKYTWEMEIKIFDKSYNQNTIDNIPVKLTPNKVMGFAIAYCDDDSGVRDNMIGTVPVHFDYGGKYPFFKFTNEFETLTLNDSVLGVPTVFSVKAQQKKPVYLDNNQPVEMRVKDALSRINLEEKVKLCTAQSIFSSNGVPRLGIPEIWMSDGPHGVRMENLWVIWEQAHWTNDSCTAFPALTCLAATWNPEMSLHYGNAIGEEARYRKKEVLLGPGVNIYRTPLNGRNFEYLGEDPYLASKMVVPYIQGVQQNGVAACVKHFALNNQEKWRHNINVELSDRALNEIYLPAFKAAVTEGKAWAIMGAYNKIRGEYACHNDLMLNKILKGDWKFDGCVISDWGGTHDTKQAILNGLDIEMGTETDGLTSRKAIPYEEYCLANPYLKMLKSGEVPLSNIEDKASRILRMIFRTSMDANKPYGSLATEEHHQVGRTVAEEGIVLLQNSAKLLPIDASKYKTIAVIGENATRKLTVGGGSSELKVKREVSPLQGFIEKFGAAKVKYTLGYASAPVSMNPLLKSNLNADSLRLEAVKLAAASEIVIFVGGLNKNILQDCESDDRRSYELPFGQNELLAELQSIPSTIYISISIKNPINQI